MSRNEKTLSIILPRFLCFYLRWRKITKKEANCIIANKRTWNRKLLLLLIVPRAFCGAPFQPFRALPPGNDKKAFLIIKRAICGERDGSSYHLILFAQSFLSGPIRDWIRVSKMKIKKFSGILLSFPPIFCLQSNARVERRNI